MMRPTPPLRAELVLLWLCLSLPAVAQGQAHARPLDPDDFERWQAIQGATLSPDGRWVAYVLAGAGDLSPKLRLEALPDGPTLDLVRGRTPLFTADSRHLAVTVDAVRGSGGARDTLALVDLTELRAGTAGAVERAGGLASAQVADGGAWIAYRLESTGEPGTLVVRDLAAGTDHRLRGVGEYRLTPAGDVVWLVREDARGEGEGVFRMETAGGAVTPVLAQAGGYAGLTLSTDGRRAAFLSAPGGSDTPVWRLHVALDEGRVRTLVGEGAPELQAGWRIRADTPLRFSTSGTRLYFGTAAPTVRMASDDVDPDVFVDVWSWTDPYLQPMQIAQLSEDRERAYRWVAHLTTGELVQLEEPGGPMLQTPRTGDEAALVALTDEPYRKLLSWDGRFVDVYLVDAATGERRHALRKVRDGASLSPTGRWVTWWDGEARSWKSLDVVTGVKSSMTAAVAFPVHDEEHDRPGPPDPYGFAGWTEGDERALVYDKTDLWAVDPAGVRPPVEVTDGVGRRDGLRFRLHDPETGTLPSGEPLLIAALDLATRDEGFYADAIGRDALPRRLVMTPHHYGVPVRARAADKVVLTRESFSQYPDLWYADGALAELVRVTNANPQQTAFRWGTEELVSWRSADGTRLQGILYKPQDFDTTKSYPLLVTLYERATGDFHRYHDPAPGSSSINRSFYVSRGYVVFAPDIAYRVGAPGQSVYDAVVPAVESLLAQGFVDRDRVGIQGHSWGGWEAAYLVTRTDLFSAAVAGAPVANMTSAYGGVRWGSGMSRMFQYEREQSRIGATLWAEPAAYVENSPLFGADRIRTPMLLMHNDEDNAVPWEQGIELFSALRRLGKPAWMLNYNGELHGLRKAANRRDWAVRMQQFFDHYLSGETAPVWMVEGVPASRKGYTLGLEPSEPASRPTTDSANPR